MQSSGRSSDLNSLASAVLRLMPMYPDGWVPWNVVARTLYGSKEYEAICAGMARLPQAKPLFACTDRVVKLTEEGIRFVGKDQGPSDSGMAGIARGVTTYAGRLRPQVVNITEVSRVVKGTGLCVHAVHVELVEESIPTETPVEFRSNGGGTTRGKIVGQEPEGNVLYISFDSEVFPSELPGRLVVDRGYLLTQLATRLEGVPAIPSLFQEILTSRRSALRPIESRESRDVAEALTVLSPPWGRLLWGPPGAGKTFALGHFAARLLLSDVSSRILVVAPSNRAVDVFMEQLIVQMQELGMVDLIRKRKILRFGYPRKASIIARPELLGPDSLDEISKEVNGLQDRIVQAEREKESSAEIAILRAELLARQEEIKDAVRTHVSECRVLATSVTMTYLAGSPVPGVSWDTVVVDEATMVPPAACAYVSSLAKSRYLVAGDPRQLGPVFENPSRTQRSGAGPGSKEVDREWMGRDIFDKSGVSSGEGMSRVISSDDARMTRITGQRRCIQPIWSKVESLYPKVELLVDEARTKKIRDLPPYPGEAVVVLDTGFKNSPSRCENEHGSWLNTYSADLAMEVACTMAAESEEQLSIAIIAPYRAQVRLLRKAVRTELRAAKEVFRTLSIEAGTVHQFQGSDADAVIFDLVDGKGRTGLGNLLRGDTGVRLSTVAITRARGKLIVLADRDWCKDPRNFDRTSNPVLWDLIALTGSGKSMPVSPPVALDKDPKRSDARKGIEGILLREFQRYEELKNVVVQHEIINELGETVSRADFAFPDVKLAVYCDARVWYVRDDRWQRDIRNRDRLIQAGWRYVVFSKRDIERATSECATRIGDIVKRKKASHLGQ